MCGLIKEKILEIQQKTFDNLRVNLILKTGNEEKYSIAVLSSEYGAGRTTVAIQLALLYARLGRRVVLIDTDLRNPTLHERFGWENSPGLVDVILGMTTVKDALRVYTADGNVDVLTAGAELIDVTGVLSSEKFKRIFEDLSEEYEVCIFDTPAMEEVQDALLVAKYTVGVVFVLHAKKSNAKKVLTAKNEIMAVNENLLGFVMNGSTEI